MLTEWQKQRFVQSMIRAAADEAPVRIKMIATQLGYPRLKQATVIGLAKRFCHVFPQYQIFRLNTDNRNESYFNDLYVATNGVAGAIELGRKKDQDQYEKLIFGS